MRCLWRPDGVGGLQSPPSARSAARQFTERYLHGQALGAGGDGERDLVSGLSGGQCPGQDLGVWCPFLPGGLDPVTGTRPGPCRRALRW
jgi:hypothetical protein